MLLATRFLLGFGGLGTGSPCSSTTFARYEGGSWDEDLRDAMYEVTMLEPDERLLDTFDACYMYCFLPSLPSVCKAVGMGIRTFASFLPSVSWIVSLVLLSAGPVSFFRFGPLGRLRDPRDLCERMD